MACCECGAVVNVANKTISCPPAECPAGQQNDPSLPFFETQRCVPCPVDTFKDTFGTSQCIVCASSKTTNGVTGAKSSSACELIQPIELVCKMTSEAQPEEDTAAPTWSRVCGNNFGYTKTFPTSYVDFVVAFKDPIGPLQDKTRNMNTWNVPSFDSSPAARPLKQQHLANIVQLTATMIGLHKSQRHLVSIRQMLQAQTGHVRALVQVAVPCPAGALLLQRLIESRIKDQASNNSSNINSTRFPNATHKPVANTQLKKSSNTHAVDFEITLPYSLQNFTADLQDNYKKAVGAASSRGCECVVSKNHVKLTVRSLPGDAKILVHVQISVPDAGDGTALIRSGDLSMRSLNTELILAGLELISSISKSPELNFVGFAFSTWREGLKYFGLAESVAGATVARYCGNGLLDVNEECDDGTGNGDAFRCSAECRCNPGYRSVSPGLCTCNFESDFYASARETTQEMSSLNNISVEIFFAKFVRGAVTTGGANSDNLKRGRLPVEVEISNLTGSIQATGVVDISCESEGWTQCQVGIPNIVYTPKSEESLLNSSNDSLIVEDTAYGEWKPSAAMLDPVKGSLRFVVLQDLPALQVLRLNFTVTNYHMAQPPRIPQVSVCSTRKPMDPRSQLLGSNQVFIEAILSPALPLDDNVSNQSTGLGPMVNTPLSRVTPSPCKTFPCTHVVRQADIWGQESVLASIFLAESPANGSILSVKALTNASRAWTTPEKVNLYYQMQQALEEGVAVTAMGGAILELAWIGNPSDVQVTLHLDEETARRHAGCHTVHLLKRQGGRGSFDLCVGGEIALALYNTAAQHWSYLTNFTKSMQSLTSTVNFDTNSPAQKMYVTIVVRPRCCGGHSCSHFVCPGVLHSTESFHVHAGKWNNSRLYLRRVTLGNGSSLRKPLFRASTRRLFELGGNLTLHMANEMADSKTYLARSNWTQICPGQLREDGVLSVSTTQALKCPTGASEIDTTNAWPSSRFGHAMHTSDGLLVMYGGVGCAQLQRRGHERVCTSTTVLDDLWKFDLNRLTFIRVAMNPKFSALYGHVLIKIPGQVSSGDILIFGGSAFFFPTKSVPSKPSSDTRESNPTNSVPMQRENDERFHFYQLDLGINRTTTQFISNSLDLGSMSGFSVVENGTHAVFFGGVVSNALSNAVFVYPLHRHTGSESVSLDKVVPSAPSPAGRACVALSVINSTLSLWMGGVYRDPLSKRLRARSDIFALAGHHYSLSDADLNVIFDPQLERIRVRLPRILPVFAGSFSLEIQEIVVTILHGGILAGELSSGIQDHISLEGKHGLQSDSYKLSDGFRAFLLGPSHDDWMHVNAEKNLTKQARELSFLSLAPQQGDFARSTHFRQGSVSCLPVPRFMQSITKGILLDGIESVVMFGGVDSQGDALSDFWLFNISGAILSNDTVGFEMWQYTTEGERLSNAPTTLSSQSDSPCFENLVQPIQGVHPGSRHGHAAVVIPNAQNRRISFLLIFGGESTGLNTMDATLTSDIHVAIFQTHGVFVSQPVLEDEHGRPCGSQSQCPVPRRDAAAALHTTYGRMRLFVFGGLTQEEGPTLPSPMRAYLDDNALNLKALNDMWFLDLSGLRFGCDRDKIYDLCEGTELRWVRAPIPGSLKSYADGGYNGLGRWGATLILVENEDTMAILGGASVQASVSRQENDAGDLRIVEHEDTFAFQLSQASAATCKMVGPPSRVMAGIEVSFRVRCVDMLRRPTLAAILKAEFRSSSDSKMANIEPSCAVEAHSSPVAFVCRFTAKVAGIYHLSVLVAGTDDSSHPELMPKFEVTVEPASAWWPRSDVTIGHSCLSSATAGEVADFNLVARDYYGNIARGSDSPLDFVLTPHVLASIVPVSTPIAAERRYAERKVDVIEIQEDEERLALRAAAIISDAASRVTWAGDSATSSYTVSFWITRSGKYSIHVASGSRLFRAGSAGMLVVTSAAADVRNSYVYGQVEEAMAGPYTPSTLFVQTRDRFGNEVTGLAFDDIHVNLCFKFGGIQGMVCGGLEQDQIHDLTVMTQFCNRESCEEADVKLTGVYKLRLTFHGQGHFMLLVTHNSTIINCYFNTLHNPGHDSADSCTRQQPVMRPRLQVLRRTIQSQSSQPAHRRAHDPSTSKTRLYTTENITVTVKPLYQGPKDEDIRFMQSMLMYVPLAAAGIALLLHTASFVWWKYRRNELNEDPMIEDSLRRKVPRNMPTKRLWSAQSSVIQSTDTQTPMITLASSKPALTTSQKSDNTVARKLIPPTQSPDGVLLSEDFRNVGTGAIGNASPVSCDTDTDSKICAHEEASAHENSRGDQDSAYAPWLARNQRNDTLQISQTHAARKEQDHASQQKKTNSSSFDDLSFSKQSPIDSVQAKRNKISLVNQFLMQTLSPTTMQTLKDITPEEQIIARESRQDHSEQRQESCQDRENYEMKGEMEAMNGMHAREQPARVLQSERNTHLLENQEIKSHLLQTQSMLLELIERSQPDKSGVQETREQETLRDFSPKDFGTQGEFIFPGHKMASNSSFGMHGATLTTQFKDAGVVISGTSANAASSIGASPAAGLQMSSRPARRSFSPKQVGSGPSETNEADGRLGRGDALALAAVAQNASHSTLDVDACLQYVTTLEEEGLITFQQAISGNRAHIVLSRPCPPHRECCALECDCDHVYCALDCDCVHVY